MAAKASQSLQAIVANDLGDQLWGSVVQGHVAGTVYYLAEVSSIDATRPSWSAGAGGILGMAQVIDGNCRSRQAAWYTIG